MYDPNILAGIRIDAVAVIDSLIGSALRVILGPHRNLIHRYIIAIYRMDTPRRRLAYRNSIQIQPVHPYRADRASSGGLSFRDFLLHQRASIGIDGSFPNNRDVLQPPPVRVLRVEKTGIAVFLSPLKIRKAHRIICRPGTSQKGCPLLQTQRHMALQIQRAALIGSRRNPHFSIDRALIDRALQRFRTQLPISGSKIRHVQYFTSSSGPNPYRLYQIARTDCKRVFCIRHQIRHRKVCTSTACPEFSIHLDIIADVRRLLIPHQNHAVRRSKRNF